MFASVCAPALAQEFADDFDNQYFDTGYVVQTRSLANADTVDSVVNGQLNVSLLSEEPEEAPETRLTCWPHRGLSIA